MYLQRVDSTAVKKTTKIVQVNNNLDDGNTPLMDAAENGDLNKVKRLIAAGANVNARNIFGCTPLMSAIHAFEAEVLATRNNYIEIVKALIAAGAKIEARTAKTDGNAGGATPLIMAAEKGNIDFINVLIEKHANVNAKNNAGWTPLMEAAVGGHIDVMQALIAKGADVNAKRDDGWTVLMEAAYGGSPDAVKVLIKAGANLRAKNEDGNNALYIARFIAPGSGVRLIAADIIEEAMANQK